MKQTLSLMLLCGCVAIDRAAGAIAPWDTASFSNTTVLFYDAALGSFVGNGAVAAPIYRQAYNPGGGPRPIGPYPSPPGPPPPIVPPYAIDDLHMAAAGVYRIDSFSIGYCLQGDNPSGSFDGRVRMFGNDASNSQLPNQVGGPTLAFYDLLIQGLPKTEGKYLLNVINVSILTTQDLWLGAFLGSYNARMLIADDAVEIGSSADLIAWEGQVGNPNYPAGAYTFGLGLGGPKADFEIELGGELVPAPSCGLILGAAGALAIRRRRTASGS